MAPMIAGEPLKAGAIVHTEANECFEWMTPAEPAPLEDQEGADTPHGSTEESSTEWFQRVMGQS
jgi:hypothetical protein